MWITVKEAAYLLNVSERTVQLSCKNERYECRCISGLGNSGKQYEICLESLPDIALMRYYGVKTTKEIITSERPNGCSEKQWQEAERKANIIKEYQASGLSVDDFINWYNETYKPKKALKRQTLFTYQRKYKKYGVTGLIDIRGGATNGNQLTEEMWEYFCSLFLTQQQRSVKLCYDKTKEKFGEPFPCVGSFERKVRSLDKYTLTYYRVGKHALEDLLPSMERDKSSINSNDIWFSDHRNIDVFVRNIKGKIYRPWVTVFFDARSNKIISYVIREDNPNSIVIKKCLRLGIEGNGVPKEVYFDNGKDYRAKEFNKDFPYSLVRQLGINAIYAHPYHGQAKTVERFFRILADRFDKLFKTYCGKDNKNRPEQMRISNSKIAKIAPTTDEFNRALGNWIEDYNNTPNGGAFMNNESPNAVYQKHLKSKVTINQEALEMLFATINTRTVHKNGITMYNKNYYDIALIPYLGRKVIVRNFPENIDKVYVFDLEDNYICSALARRLTPYRNTSEQDYKNAQKEKKAVYEHIKKYAPKKNLDVHELIAKNQAEEYYLKNNINEIECNTTQVQTISIPPKASDNKKKVSNLSVVMNEYYKNKKQA